MLALVGLLLAIKWLATFPDAEMLSGLSPFLTLRSLVLFPFHFLFYAPSM